MAAVLQESDDGLLYTEGDYTAFCCERPTATPAQLIAWFGAHRVLQMEKRFLMEHCAKCDQEVTEEEANEADKEGRDPICADCGFEGPYAFGRPRDDPDGEWSELE